MTSITPAFEVIEVQAALLARNFELLRRRDSGGEELDRAEYLLLRTLETVGANHITVLADALGLDPSTAGRQVATMVDHGLVERRVDEEDRRRSVVAVTAVGRRRMRTTSHLRGRRTRELLGDWSETDLRRLGEMFTRYNQAVARKHLV